jgi:hypothetical protein
MLDAGAHARGGRFAGGARARACRAWLERHWRRADHARTGHAPGCGRTSGSCRCMVGPSGQRSRSAGVAAGYAHSGLRHLLCTDIARDGMLSGPNHRAVSAPVARSPVGAGASVGRRARPGRRACGAGHAGCAGVILGRALLEQRLTLPEALAC